METKERAELIRELIDSGCNKSFSELDEKSDTYLSDYKTCLDAKKRDKSELINEYLNIDNPDKIYDAESIQRLDNFNIMKNILIEQAFKQSKDKIQKENQSFINSIDMNREDESGSFVSDLTKFNQLKDQIKDIADDDSKVNIENSKILYENKLRADIGLSEKPLLLTKNQLFLALSLDDFQVGETCQELLEQYSNNPFLKNKYVHELQTMSNTYQAQQLSIQREKETISNIKSKYAILSNVPEKLIKTDTNKFQISEAFLNWQKESKSLLGKITNMIRAEQSKENAISDYKVDKRSSLYRIRENIVKLLKDNI